jgi:hypothetical protein
MGAPLRPRVQARDRLGHQPGDIRQFVSLKQDRPSTLPQEYETVAHFQLPGVAARFVRNCTLRPDQWVVGRVRRFGGEGAAALVSQATAPGVRC